ncbi:hypothetical protein BDW74DRAFT_149324 [Aspergillus multicolor]|uniref:uncharacterized protein n=1 Tax=Aspergillus multicolor TaxID=41759 RepID=UPI003CCCE1E2
MSSVQPSPGQSHRPNSPITSLSPLTIRLTKHLPQASEPRGQQRTSALDPTLRLALTSTLAMASTLALTLAFSPSPSFSPSTPETANAPATRGRDLVVSLSGPLELELILADSGAVARESVR